MPMSIALLRSVNVPGKNMIKMPGLARAFKVVCSTFKIYKT